MFSVVALLALTIVLSGCNKTSVDNKSAVKPIPTPAVDPKDVYQSQLSNNINASASKSASKKDQEIIDGRTAILADVNGGSIRGEGGVYRNFGIYNVYAKIKLDKPSGNNFYEGWVTNPQTKEYFSIGKLEVDTAGNYNVTYNTDNIHPGFDRIVITLETISDKTPEKHIAEGTLENTLNPVTAK